MRIVHLTQSTTAEITGGLEYHIANLTAALRQRGHEVIVLNTESFPNKSKNLAAKPQDEAPLAARRGAHLLPKTFWQDLDAHWETMAMFTRRMMKKRAVKVIADHIDHLNPDVVHQHSYIGGLGLCRLISRKYPVVFTNHTGAYLHFDRIVCTRWLQRQLMKRFAAVIGPSRELSPRTVNSHYIPNGVDPSKFFPVSGVELHRLEKKYRCVGKQVFLCPRRWAPTKGVIYLAKALRHLSRSTLNNSVFIFSGNETPGYKKYQRNIRDVLNTVEGEVRVLGNLGQVELAELMNISRVCIIPSLMEATSLACLEAMASGTPVVGTETPGLVELIRDGVNGWLTPLRNDRALAARIELIAGMSQEDLRRMGQDAMNTVREHYTWKIAAFKTEEIYRVAMQGANRSAGRQSENAALRMAPLREL